MSKAEREAMRAQYATAGPADVNMFMERLPRDMLFVMRTWALVRSLNRSLGGTARRRFLTIADAAARANTHDALTGAMMRGRGMWLLTAVRAHCARLAIGLRLHAYDVAFHLAWYVYAERAHNVKDLG